MLKSKQISDFLKLMISEFSIGTGDVSVIVDFVVVVGVVVVLVVVVVVVVAINFRLKIEVYVINYIIIYGTLQ